MWNGQTKFLLPPLPSHLWASTCGASLAHHESVWQGRGLGQPQLLQACWLTLRGKSRKRQISSTEAVSPAPNIQMSRKMLPNMTGLKPLKLQCVRLSVDVQLFLCNSWSHTPACEREKFLKGILLSLGLPGEVGWWRYCRTPHGPHQWDETRPHAMSRAMTYCTLSPRRVSLDSSLRFKLFSLCEIFHLLNRQGSLALGWLPWGWMGKLHSSRAFYCCLLYFAQTAFLWPCAQCQWV